MAHPFPGRRFSWLRFSILAVIVAVLAFAGVTSIRQVQDTARAEAEGTPWFAGYADVTATPVFPMETTVGPGRDHVALSFIVAAADGRCLPTWGAAYTMDQAAADLDLDRRLARMQQQERDLIVSFGGQANQELALACGTVTELKNAYRSVIDRYKVTTIDLDIEGLALDDAGTGWRRAAAVAELQREIRDSDGSLAVWLTLPATTSGLTESGTDLVALFLKEGVDLAGVNIMTMNYGGSRDGGESMADASIRALTATHRQLGILYDQAGSPLGEQALWRKIGATPMIGQNDIRDEVFGLDDAQALNAFAVEQGLGRMSMWSLNRDTSCSVNYGDTGRVSDSCSGVDQDGLSYAALLAEGFTGNPGASAGAITVPEPTESIDPTDDPETSPYPIWNEDSSYPAGAKVVWHRNVYEAKWWTQGDVPDDPVLQESQTPWRLIGPVLEGETPIEVPKLPADFYPQWEAGTIYVKGDRVMLDGDAFEAQWWTQGDSPESALQNPGASPWRMIGEDEISRLLEEGPA